MLYVEPIRSPLWRVKRAATQTRQPAGPPREVAPNVWLLTLPALFTPMFLYRRWSVLRHFNNWLMTRWVRKAAASLGLNAPIVWAYQITYAGAALLREADLSVYDCIDEWAGAARSPSEKRFFTELDRALCESADVLFTGSQNLAAARRQLNPHHAMVPQGVDLAHFLPPLGAPLPPPADLAALRGPVIGLVGVLNHTRIDIDLLCHLAAARPQWSIALVGPVWKGLDTARLAGHANIHLLGNKPREELGRYIGGFDVCMLPYLINDFTRNIFPLKLFEYLASGKPFVSTPIPACAEFPRLIRTAADHTAFVAAVDDALAESDPALRAERISLARENDWDRPTADKVRFVAARLAADAAGGRASLARNASAATAVPGTRP